MVLLRLSPKGESVDTMSGGGPSLTSAVSVALATGFAKLSAILMPSALHPTRLAATCAVDGQGEEARGVGVRCSDLRESA